ncbi:MAG: Cysteine synthase [Alphaproteobacteria bacterium MarineAlpha3_Bin5]|nr:pyridoxal-5'-phosphate-dependent protein subunit beta [Magnetovibrio sp.]PPR75845.1 MAG: Cysteine synthase [Alphaproteobacteria bacterium MarineAlpha3_Bin5]
MQSHASIEIVDHDVFNRNKAQLKLKGVTLPKFSELANPVDFLPEKIQSISEVDPDTPHPENLFRVHWHNANDRQNLTLVPGHIVLGQEITGVEAKIIIILGNRFPMIKAHKVVAAYGCLTPYILSGEFDVSWHRAIWPSTGNYCRGGIAISRILGCRGVAVLPEGMSAERFDWLHKWIKEPTDIVRTPGTESNVKEIYDKCNELAKDPQNKIINQFSEIGNYIVHRAITGPALERVFNNINSSGVLVPKAYVAASGSAGTLAAGDFLKKTLGTDICVVEALECPTLLYNGYGEHNIQGIGDKHVPLIHNVLNSDFVIGISSFATDSLNLLFNTKEGLSYLSERTGLSSNDIFALSNLGLSSIANLLGAIKYAKYMNLGSTDAVLTIATDGAELYKTELDREGKRLHGGKFSKLKAAETYGQFLLGASTDHVLELDRLSRERIFNLGYYTWVEQQGVSVVEFDARRQQNYWDQLMGLIPIWDELIDRFNNVS